MSKSIPELALERARHVETTQATIASERAAAVAKLQLQIGSVNERAAADTSAVEGAAEQKRQEIATKLSRDFFVDMQPLTAAWVLQPTRELAGKIAAIWGVLDVKARAALGTAPRDTLLATAFMDAVIATQPNAVLAFCPNPLSNERVAVEESTATVRAFDQGIPSAFAALCALEAKLTAVAATAVGQPDTHAKRRYATLRGVTHLDANRAYDEAVRIERTGA